MVPGRLWENLLEEDELKAEEDWEPMLEMVETSVLAELWVRRLENFHFCRHHLLTPYYHRRS